MLSQVKSFVLQKFWTPIVDESVFYNPFNTAVYAILFGAAAIYLVFPAVKRLGIDFDREFFLGIAPYIFLAGALRSLKDIGAVETILLETPFIFGVMFVFGFTSLTVSRKIENWREIPYHKVFGGIGLTALAATLPFYTVANWNGLWLFLAVTVLWAVPLYLGTRILKPGLLVPAFLLPIAAHFYDATTTVVVLASGGAEKHVLAGLFIDVFGPAGMFLMKSLVIIPATYYVYNSIEGEERNYYLFVIAMLGIAIGTRNLLSVLALG